MRLNRHGSSWYAQIDSTSRMQSNSHPEFQIPPQVARYASFMFSFLGRGVCTYTWKSREEGHALIPITVYIFIGCIIMGDNWWKYTAGALVTFVGIGYAALEFVPSIEPPANMRYVRYPILLESHLTMTGTPMLLAGAPSRYRYPQYRSIATSV